MKTHCKSVLFFGIVYLIAGCLHAQAQYKGGVADGHANLRQNIILCVVINTNPFKGGAGDGAANDTKINTTCTLVNVNPFLGGVGDGFTDLNLTNIICLPVNVNPFLGGTGDGHADLRLTNIICTPVNVNPFLGGIGDGFTESNLTNIICIPVNVNPFLGGGGDGSSDLSLVNIICTPINVNPFLGGIGDGHSNLRLTNVTCIPINVNPFLGGVADGHGLASVQNVFCVPVNVNPFLGGFADGHANMRLVNVTCSVVNVNPYLGGRASGFSFKSMTNILCGNSPLPIRLLLFEAKLDDDKVLLTWETASEINNDYFTVEKSSQDMSFEKVIDIKGLGNSNSILTYETVDVNPFDGVSYYRLKQTDYDGTYTFSQTEEVNFKHTTATCISPNPVNDDKDIMLRLESPHDEMVSIRIRDALGTLVCSFSRSSFKGENNFLFKAPFLHNGLYFVDIQSTSKTETLKLLVDK